MCTEHNRMDTHSTLAAAAAAVAMDQPPQQNKFSLPVDTEHKTTVIRPLSCAAPHMVAFHCSWLSFFAAWLSTFSPAALLPVIREDLNLTRTDVGNAGIAATCGAVLGRIVMGTAVDVYGPRYCMCCCLALTCPAVFLIALTHTATGFIVARLVIGFTLSNFAANQFWCSAMFSTTVVGTANACGAGLANAGGGFTLMLMPLVYEAIVQSGVPTFQAWRLAFLVPGCFQVAVTVLTLMLAQDLPDGNYSDLKQQGIMQKQASWQTWKRALANYRTWVMMLTYACSFGVELTVDNLLSQYMYDQFSLDLRLAGILASVFGLMNVLSRPSGGWLSDAVAARWGMRGRLWALWAVQTLAGVMCIVTGLASHSLPATMAALVLLSLLCQQSAGLSFGVVPFVSKRAAGLVAGLVGAGGNVGASISQAVFFTYSPLTAPQGFVWMGVTAVGITCCYFLVNFPMWGGMLSGPQPGFKEELYYLAEFTLEEMAQGLHTASLKFAHASQSQRSRSHRPSTSTEHRGSVTTTASCSSSRSNLLPSSSTASELVHCSSPTPVQLTRATLRAMSSTPRRLTGAEASVRI